jgi:amidase, hydantoinase/carbamoylase family
LWRAVQNAGFRPDNLSEPSIRLDRVAAFLEIHIEQGRTLEETDTDIGVVSSIRGPVRHRFTVTGNYDHSGATPMTMRRDALAAASEMIVAIEDVVGDAAADGDVVGTVGTIDPKDGAINTVCGEVVFPLDLRSADAEYRDTVESTVVDEIERIAADRDVEVASELIDRTAPVALDAEVVSTLESAAESVDTRYRRMPSGGGHDAMNFQRTGIPAGMLFVPSIDGVSHHPDEETTTRAIRDATRTLTRTLLQYERP